ncbi:MAG: nitroreductase family protein [Candidatus Altiarchaeota archaeon]
MITDSIKSRRSVRKYSPKKVPGAVVDDILDCGRLAPTARNAQPWRLCAVTSTETLKSLGQLADHGRFIAESAVCFAVFCQKDEKYYLEDGCAAAMNIIHACHAHGLGSCWVAGDKKAYAEAVGKLLCVPIEYALVALVPAGFPDEAPAPQKKPASGVLSRI